MSIVPFNLQKNLIVNASGNLMCIDALQPFTFKINTIYGNGNNTFALPLTNNTTNLKIETSDGQYINITNYTDPAKLINFPSAGVYTIKMRGECGWSFNNAGDCQKLIGISKWGRLKFNYIQFGFNGCINLGLNEGLPNTGSIYAPNVISLVGIFKSCNLVTIPWMLFNYCTKVTFASEMFHTNRINNLPANLLDPLINVILLDYTFFNNKIPSIPIGFLDKVVKVTSMNATFRTNLIASLDGGLLEHCTKLTSLNSTFRDNRITSAGAGLFDKCILVDEMSLVLYANLLTNVPDKLFYYNVNVTKYYRALRESCATGVTLPLNIFNSDLTVLYKVTDFREMFYCASGKSITGTVQDIWNYANPTATKTDCFQDCTGLANHDDIPTDWI